MPAAIRSKTTALADITNDAGKGMPLAGMVFAFSGKFSASQVSLKSIVERFGGSCAGSVTKKVTHVVTTPASLALDERPTALATAVGRGLPMLSEAFLHSLADDAGGGRAASPSKHLLHAGGSGDAEKTKQLANAKEIVEQELQGAREAEEVRKWGLACRNHYRSMARAHLWEWSSLVKLLWAGREQAERNLSLCEEALMGSFMSAWADLVAKKKHLLDSVTSGLAGLMLTDASRREMAYRSLRPQKDERTRLLVDTNVYLDEPAQVWDHLEAAYADKVKIFVPLAVFEEVDKLRKSRDRELQGKARGIMAMLREKLGGDSCTRRGGCASGGFWEMQEREVDAEYQQRKEISESGNRSQDLRMMVFAKDVNNHKPGTIVLVTNDVPFAAEFNASSMRSLSSKELLVSSGWSLMTPREHQHSRVAGVYDGRRDCDKGERRSDEHARDRRRSHSRPRERGERRSDEHARDRRRSHSRPRERGERRTDEHARDRRRSHSRPRERGERRSDDHGRDRRRDEHARDARRENSTSIPPPPPGPPPPPPPLETIPPPPPLDDIPPPPPPPCDTFQPPPPPPSLEAPSYPPPPDPPFDTLNHYPAPHAHLQGHPSNAHATPAIPPPPPPPPPPQMHMQAQNHLASSHNQYVPQPGGGYANPTHHPWQWHYAAGGHPYWWNPHTNESIWAPHGGFACEGTNPNLGPSWRGEHYHTASAGSGHKVGGGRGTAEACRADRGVGAWRVVGDNELKYALMGAMAAAGGTRGSYVQACEIEARLDEACRSCVERCGGMAQAVGRFRECFGLRPSFGARSVEICLV